MTAATQSESAARLAFALSADHCTGCRSYHAVWPYLRLIDPPRGVDADRAPLLAMLGPLIAAETRVLLAGSADAGLAETVLDAAAGRPFDLAVMDLCDTPLQQCMALLRQRAGGRLLARRGSIAGAPIVSGFDLILAHSVLAFLSETELARAAAFVGGSLRPGGRLVMTTALGKPVRAHDPAIFRDHVLTALAARRVALPDTGPVFAGLLEDYARGRLARSSPFADQDGLRHWLDLAGLTVETLQPLRRGTAFPIKGPLVARASEGVLVLARKRDGA